jgi:hypothetical protein
VIVEAIASPLTLLEEAAADRRPSGDVLLLTFNANLGFFERFALPIARATQGRVTVVGDASAVTTDLRTRYAGISYLADPVEVPGALFHPKVVVITGEARATVAVGSANVSLDGWHGNAELWTVLRADESGCPEAILQVARWLRLLPLKLRATDLVAKALVRVAAQLETLTPTIEGPRVVTSAEGAIIDQLPHAPVDELTLVAPFYDKDAAGVEALLDRLQPTRWEVLLQPKAGVYDGDRIAEVAEKRGGSVAELTSDRYHHGKLLEWKTGGRRYAVTGSPNISRAALLRSMGQRGNCEIGLLAEIEASLRPSVRGVPSSSVRGHQYNPVVYATGATITLLGAVIEDEGIRLQVSRPLDDGAVMEVRDPFGDWFAVGPVPARDKDPFVSESVAPGSAVKIVLGPETSSNAVHVADPALILRRFRSGGQAVVPGKVTQLLKDDYLLGQLMSAFGQLRQEVMHERVKAARPQRKESREPGRRPRGPTMSAEEWLYYDECAGVLGEGLVAFALGLPNLGVHQGPSTEGDDEFEDETFEIVDEGKGPTTPTPEDPPTEEESPTLPDFSQRAEAVQRRFRSWCKDLGDQVGELAFLGRLAALRILLIALAGRLWPYDSEDWVGLVAHTTSSLAAGSEGDREQFQAASLSAIALAVLRARIRLTDRGPMHRLYQQVSTAVAPLLADRDEDVILNEIRQLGAPLGVTLGSVADVVEVLERSDPLADAVDALLERGIEAEIDGVLLEIVDECSDPVQQVLKAVDLAQDAKPVAARARGRGGWALAVWNEPALLLVTQVPKARRWVTYSLPSGKRDLHAYVTESGRIPSRHERQNSYGPDPTPEARSFLEQCGIIDPSPP